MDLLALSKQMGYEFFAAENAERRRNYLDMSDGRAKQSPMMPKPSAVETSKRVAVEAVRLNSGKVGHVLATWPKQPATALAVSH